MSWVSRVVHFVGRLLHPGRADQELTDEVQSYFEIQAERRVSEGLSPEEARRVTRVQFGGADQVKENVREARRGNIIETTFTDIRYAGRVLRKNPGFAVVAILSLGLGLGANTAIFSLINTVMLKSLPVKAPDRLFFIDNSGGKSGGSSGPPYPCYEILRDQNHYFSGLAAFSGERLKVTIDGVSEQIIGQYASGSYFDVLGVGAALGRVLTSADDSEIGRGGPQGAVGVISYKLWERRFGRSPDVLGKSVQVGTTWVTIVGVTPPEFFGLTVGSPIDITVPMVLTTTNNLHARKSWWFSVVGRLRDGASEVPARAEMDRYFHTYMDDVRMTDRKYFTGIVLVPAAKGLEELRRQFSKPLLIVMTIVGLCC